MSNWEGIWKTIRETYWGGMKNPDLAAYEIYFARVRLLVIHDSSGWACKCLIFGEHRLAEARNVEDAKKLAVAHLETVLQDALEAMGAMAGAGR